MKKLFSIILLTLLLTSMLTLASNFQSAWSSPKTIIVPDDYPTIQDAINAAISGDIIFVKAGTYYENVVVNKTVTLIGESKEATIIDGSRAGTVISVTENNVTLTGFTMQNGTIGIYVTNSNGVTIRFNFITDNQYDGIFLGDSNNGAIINNHVKNNKRGVHIKWASLNTLYGNNISDNEEYGIALWECGTGNIICSNLLQNNTYNICLSETGGTKVYHNNFFKKNIQVYGGLLNIWDDGYPSGGNYWSDYTGVDARSGFDQNEAGSDGIGDAAHEIDADNIDRYPLMGPFSTFNAGTWDGTSFNVDVISNSTVSGFQFDVDQKSVSFNVSHDDGTTGFCRVTIPNDLLWVDDGWTIIVGDQQITDYKIILDLNLTYLYFSYNHSTKAVTIQGTHVIPELQPAMIMPLFLILTTLAIILTKKKAAQTKNQKLKPSKPYFSNNPLPRAKYKGKIKF